MCLRSGGEVMVMVMWCCGGEYSKLEFLIRESPTGFLQNKPF